MQERYIVQRDAPLISASLSDAADDLTSTDDPGSLADAPPIRLQQTNGDRHLRMRHRAKGAASGLDGAEYEARWAAEAVRNAGGIRQVRLLPRNIGLLQIAPSLSPVHLAEPYIRAAFTLLASVDGLVIDLCEGWQGGTTETVAPICGHLLGDHPVHLQDIHERGAAPRQHWTSPAAIRIDAPVQVLTSHDTFSGCEELAYNLQAHRRAVVVGEPTGGGAHLRRSVQVDRVPRTASADRHVCQCDHGHQLGADRRPSRSPVPCNRCSSDRAAQPPDRGVAGGVGGKVER